MLWLPPRHAITPPSLALWLLAAKLPHPTPQHALVFHLLAPPQGSMGGRRQSMGERRGSGLSTRRPSMSPDADGSDGFGRKDSGLGVRRPSLVPSSGLPSRSPSPSSSHPGDGSEEGAPARGSSKMETRRIMVGGGAGDGDGGTGSLAARRPDSGPMTRRASGAPASFAASDSTGGPPALGARRASGTGGFFGGDVDYVSGARGPGGTLPRTPSAAAARGGTSTVGERRRSGMGRSDWMTPEMRASAGGGEPVASSMARGRSMRGGAFAAADASVGARRSSHDRLGADIDAVPVEETGDTPDGTSRSLAHNERAGSRSGAAKAPSEGRAPSAAGQNRRPSVGGNGAAPVSRAGRVDAVRSSLMEAAVSSAPAPFATHADDRVASLFDATATGGATVGHDDDGDGDGGGSGTHVVVAVTGTHATAQ